MTQPIRGVLVYLLSLNLLVGCGVAPPQATQTAPVKSTSSVAPEAGWKVFTGDGVRLTLPDNYEGGNPSTEMDQIAKRLKAIDPSYEERIGKIEQRASAIALLAFDPQSSESGFLTNVNITKEEVPAGVTVEQYLQAATQQLDKYYQVVEQTVVPLNLQRAGRIVVEGKAGETPIKQLFYTVQSDNTFWLITYSTTVAEFDQQLPKFEQSIQTFTFPS